MRTVTSCITRHAHRSIGIVLLLCILSRIDIHRVANDLSLIRLPFFVLALCLLVPIIFLKAVRWNALLRFQRIALPMKDAFLIYWAGVFLGHVTPGRVGDFAKIVYIARLGHPLGKSIFGVVLDRVSDLSLFVALAYVSSACMMRAFSRAFGILSAALAALAVAALMFVRGRDRLSRAFRALLHPLLGARLARGVEMTGGGFLKEVGAMDAGIIARVAVASLADMAFILAHYWLIAASLGVRLSPLQLTAAVTFSSVASLIPVSLLGVGTRDTALILTFAYFGYARETALSFSFLILISAVIDGIVGFFCWMRRPIRFRDIAAIGAGPR